MFESCLRNNEVAIDCSDNLLRLFLFFTLTRMGHIKTPGAITAARAKICIYETKFIFAKKLFTNVFDFAYLTDERVVGALHFQ